MAAGPDITPSLPDFRHLRALHWREAKPAKGTLAMRRRKAADLSASLISAIATILILILLVTGRLSASPTPHDGDLIFQTSQSRQSAAILAATDSNYTHMGIVHLRDGEPYVIEAYRTVEETPLADWIARGEGDRYSLYRVQHLSPGQATTAIDAALSYLGQPYDPFFRDSDDAIYCSELVRLAFEAAGIELGEIETVGDLDIDSPSVRTIFAERWQKHPDCADAADSDECWNRMLSQTIVTPASIASDGKLVLVDSNF